MMGKKGKRQGSYHPLPGRSKLNRLKRRKHLYVSLAIGLIAALFVAFVLVALY